MKISKRKKNALSIVSVATALKVYKGSLSFVKIALGSVGPKPFLAEKAISFLRECARATDENIMIAAEIASTEAKPSARGLRGSSDYRKAMINVLTKRALIQALNRAREKEVEN